MLPCMDEARGALPPKCTRRLKHLKLTKPHHLPQLQVDRQDAGSEEEEEGLLCNFILLRGPSAKKGGALYLSLLSFNMMFSFLAKKMG